MYLYWRAISSSGLPATEGSLGPETEAKLIRHRWPGTSRIAQVIERAFVLADGRPSIAPEQILIRKPCASVRFPSASS